MTRYLLCTPQTIFLQWNRQDAKDVKDAKDAKDAKDHAKIKMRVF